METNEFQITGKSNFAEYVRLNLEKIVSAKLNVLREETGYIYLHVDGELREGRNDHYGQSSVADFGGKSPNKFTAVRELQRLVWMHESQQFNGDAKLKKYLI